VTLLAKKVRFLPVDFLKHTWNVNVPPRDGGDLPL
jgi:hypothetical protein